MVSWTVQRKFSISSRTRIQSSFFISDNTGSAATSGGSDDLVTYMKQEKFSPAHNTQNGVVNLPKTLASSFNVSKGVRLGAVDFRLW